MKELQFVLTLLAATVNAAIVVPLYGNATDLNYYYIKVQVGSEKQVQNLLLDTGSPTIGFPCEQLCNKKGSCGEHMVPWFYNKASTTHRFKNCDSESKCQVCNFGVCLYQAYYGEGSQYKGWHSIDTFMLESTKESISFEMDFGCVRFETGKAFDQKANGVFGLANFYPNLMPHHKPFIAVIKEQHNLDAIFVICLGKDGGFFSIGVPAMTHEVVFEKVPFLKNHKIYTVELQDFRFGKRSIPIETDHAFVLIDTGTTFTKVPQSMYDALKMLLEEECKSLNCGGKFADDQEDFICFEYAAGEGPIAYFESFPVITLMLGDSPFIWHPSEYFYRKKEDRYCLGLKAWEQTGVMLGTFGLRQKLLVFNLEQNQLEFVPFICSSDQFRVTNLEPKPMKVKATDEL